jgi:ribonuclease VapC
LDRVYVLDSFAVIAHLEGEDRGERVTSILKEAQSGRVILYLSVINLGEVHYITLRERGAEAAGQILQLIKLLPITIIDADFDLTIKASILKSKYPIAYADCFAASLALDKGAKLITGDPEFKRMENEVKIEWI